MTAPAPAEIAFGPDGLVPAVVQDAADGRVLMVACMDAEALAATVSTGEVHFHSRSRDRLWRKGETSGNVLRLVRLVVDCDGDALLVRVHPTGPTCHRGTRTCFDAEGRPPIAWARGSPGSRRRATIGSHDVERPEARAPPDCSLAASMPWRARSRRRPPRYSSPPRTTPPPRPSASIGRSLRGALVKETADLLYHALVLLAERGATPAASSTSSGRATAGSGQRGPRRARLRTVRWRPYRTRRPSSRRRFPIRTSRHAPSIGSGSRGRIRHLAPVDRQAAAGDHPPRLAPRGKDSGVASAPRCHRRRPRREREAPGRRVESFQQRRVKDRGSREDRLRIRRRLVGDVGARASAPSRPLPAPSGPFVVPERRRLRRRGPRSRRGSTC